MKTALSLHYIPCQTETSIAETRREKKRASEPVSEEKKKKVDTKKILRKKVPECEGAPVRKL